MFDRTTTEKLIRSRLTARLQEKRAELLLSNDEVEAVAGGYEYLGGPTNAFKVTTSIGGNVFEKIYAEAKAATEDVIHRC
jgi:hypothetical protein